MPDIPTSSSADSSDVVSTKLEASTKEDLNSHHHLTQAIHTIDLLNSQLGIAGAALVNLYHLQRQRESLAAQPPPGYAPYPYPQSGYQQTPPPNSVQNYPPQPAGPPAGYYQAPPQPPYSPPQPNPQPYYPPNSALQNPPQPPTQNQSQN